MMLSSKSSWRAAIDCTQSFTHPQPQPGAQSLSLAQLDGQDVFVPSQRWPPQIWVDGAVEQWPSLPGTSQAAQGAPQSESQQRPSTQTPVAHSRPWKHDTPRPASRWPASKPESTPASVPESTLA